MKTKLVQGIYGPVVAVRHNSGLGGSFDGDVPSDIQSVSCDCKTQESGILGVCKTRPLLARLAWPVWKRCWTTDGPLASPPVLQRGGADWVPELSNSFCPVLTGGCDMDRMGSGVSERGWHRGARVWAAAPGRAADASSLTPLCSLEGGQPLLCRCCRNGDKR